MDIKQELTNDLIPRLEKMLTNEHSHLSFLLESKEALNKITFTEELTKVTEGKAIQIDAMIRSSQSMTNHLAFMLQQYLGYAKSLNQETSHEEK